MLHGILNGPEMKSGSSDNCIVGQDGGDESFDVAYRRAAAGLAAAAWGSDYNDEYSSNSPRSFRNKGKLRCGDLDGQRSFSAFRFVGKSMAPDWPNEMRKNKVLPSSNAPTDESYNRTSKVAKASYSDHGSHAHRSRTESDEDIGVQKIQGSSKTSRIIKKLVVELETTYKHIKNNIEKQEQLNEKKHPQSVHESNTQSNLNNNNKINGSSDRKPSGIHAALAMANKSTQDENTEDSLTQGPCLTSPSSPTSNNGLDNSEGNLILHVNDIISIPTSSINFHSVKSRKRITANSNGNVMNLLVIDLLGQGTFAQVFKCKNMSSGEIIAIKIVKNKPAFTRQAAIEIDVFRELATTRKDNKYGSNNEKYQNNMKDSKKHVVELLCDFKHQSHLCLAFELLGLNLYEVLKKRQFRGLPISIVQALMKQAIKGVNVLREHSVVHCDLKPENILLLDDEPCLKSDSLNDNLSTGSNANDDISSDSLDELQIKLIDFGSACFEGHSAHTYIQSRFYRSPEVIVGLSYDSAIDMWSLGCVAAELFLGLPILPGVHEHDQLCRICEMIAPIPEWMIEQGTKSKKYFVRTAPKVSSPRTRTPPPTGISTSPKPFRSNWKLKTRQEYIDTLSEKERGDKAKLDQQPNRYFKRKLLSDIVALHGHYYQNEDKETLHHFIHFLKGTLDPDPWKRWTASQVSEHPFLTGKTSESYHTSNEVYWSPPYDPSICHRKLISVAKKREKQASLRRSNAVSTPPQIVNSISADSQVNSEGHIVTDSNLIATRLHSPGTSSTSRVTAMAESMSLSNAFTKQGVSLPIDPIYYSPRANSPPSSLSGMNKAPDNGRVSGLPSHAPSLLATSMNSLYQLDNGRYLHHAAQSYNNYNSTNMGHMASSMRDSGSGWVDPQYSSNLAMFPPHPNVQNYPYPMHHVPPPAIAGPQSFSGACYERINQHLPVEGDLGYALQRPGNVPSMGDHQPGIGSHQQGFPYMNHPPFGPNDNSMSRSSHGMNSNSVSHNMHSSRLSSSLTNNGMYTGPPPQTSPRISQDRSMEMPVVSDVVEETSAPTGHSGSRGLLAQQLAEHSDVGATTPTLPTQTKHNQHHLASPYRRHGHSYNGPSSLGSNNLSAQQHFGSYHNMAPTNPPHVILPSTPGSFDPSRMPPPPAYFNGYGTTLMSVGEGSLPYIHNDTTHQRQPQFPHQHGSLPVHYPAHPDLTNVTDPQNIQNLHYQSPHFHQQPPQNPRNFYRGSSM